MEARRSARGAVSFNEARARRPGEAFRQRGEARRGDSASMRPGREGPGRPGGRACSRAADFPSFNEARARGPGEAMGWSSGEFDELTLQ